MARPWQHPRAPECFFHRTGPRQVLDHRCRRARARPGRKYGPHAWLWREIAAVWEEDWRVVLPPWLSDPEILRSKGLPGSALQTPFRRVEGTACASRTYPP